jgi:hypothetical protein
MALLGVIAIGVGELMVLAVLGVVALAVLVVVLTRRRNPPPPT